MIYADHRYAEKTNFRSKGFTIVELLVVIVVIGILAAITIVSYGAITTSAKERAVSGEAQGISAELKKYKSSNGVFPADLTNIKKSSDYTYGYAKYDSNSFCVSATKNNITFYVLSGNSDPKKGECEGLAAGGANAPTAVTATASSTSQITLSWTAPASFTPPSYTVQYSTKSNFSPASSLTNITTTSQSISSLAPSTNYYFRVQANTSQGGGSYSTTANGSTYTDWSVYSRLTGVGDWNNDGKNDIVGYKTDGGIYLHLGGGNSTFGPAVYVTNIGTGVQALTGLGKLGTNSTVTLWWWQTPSNNPSVIRSDGNVGVSAGIKAVIPNGWNVINAATFAPKLMNNGTPIIIAKYTSGTVDLRYWSPDTSGNSTDVSNVNNGGWQSSYPGDRVFGAGDWSGDGIGDVIGIKTDGTLCLYTGDGIGGWKAGGGCTVPVGSGWVNDRVYGGWDYSGDNKPDILRYYIPSNILYVYQGNGASGFGSTVIAR